MKKMKSKVKDICSRFSVLLLIPAFLLMGLSFPESASAKALSVEAVSPFCAITRAEDDMQVFLYADAFAPWLPDDMGFSVVFNASEGLISSGWN